MGGDMLPLKICGHGFFVEFDIQPFPYMLVRDGVVIFVVLEMAVRMDLDLLPVAELILRFGKGGEGRLLFLVENILPGFSLALQGAGVELFQKNVHVANWEG